MLKAVLQDQGLQSLRATNNFHIPTEYNYNETTTTKYYDFTSPIYNDGNQLKNMRGNLNNPLPPANVYVGSKNIKPLMEPKGYTGLEMYQSGRNNSNILPFKDTFSNKQYYTYI